jgi:hypothetical protein
LFVRNQEMIASAGEGSRTASAIPQRKRKTGKEDDVLVLLPAKAVTPAAVTAFGVRVVVALAVAAAAVVSVAM